jgi:hypothetical protein
MDLPTFSKRTTELIPDLIITEDMIVKKLKNLNPSKAKGPDDVHPLILKATAETICLPLNVIFNQSLTTSKLPDMWKSANVTPIFKKGDRHQKTNYRPVSLTSIVCKVMEKTIRDAILLHMKNNNLFSKLQFGFLGKRSTVLQLIHVVDIWTKMLDEGHTVTITFLDFMKAFDKVPHRRLNIKLEGYGISGDIGRWIANFLHGRRQRVIVEGSTSTWEDVVSGVPQG